MHDQQVEGMARLRLRHKGQRGFVTVMVAGFIALMLLLAFSYSYAAKRNVENVQGSGAGGKAQKAAEAGIYHALQDARIKFKAIEESGRLASPEIIEVQDKTYVNGRDDASGIFSLTGEIAADRGDSKIRVNYMSQGEYKGAIRRVQATIAYSKPVSLTYFFKNGVRSFNLLSNNVFNRAWSITDKVEVDWRKSERSFFAGLLGLTNYDDFDSAMAVFGPRLPKEFDYTFRIGVKKGDGRNWLEGEGIAISYGTKDEDFVGNSYVYSIEYATCFEKVNQSRLWWTDRRYLRGNNDEQGGMLLAKKQDKPGSLIGLATNFFIKHGSNETRPTYAPFKDNASGNPFEVRTEITAIPLDADSGMGFTIHRLGEILGILDYDYYFPIKGLKQQVESVRKKEGFKFDLYKEHDFRIKVTRDEDRRYRHYVYVDGVLALHFTDDDPIDFSGGRFGIRVWNTQAEIISMKGPPPEIEQWQQL